MPEALLLKKPVPESAPDIGERPEDVFAQDAPAAAEAERLVMPMPAWLASSLSGTPPRIQRSPDDGDTGAAPGGETEAAAPQWIVDDDAEELLPGQMRKSEFLAALEDAVCRTAEEMLAGTPWSATGCPYIQYWFQYYEGRDAAHIQRAARRYVPGQEGVTSASIHIA